jgi:hypothetical protein
LVIDKLQKYEFYKKSFCIILATLLSHCLIQRVETWRLARDFIYFFYFCYSIMKTRKKERNAMNPRFSQTLAMKPRFSQTLAMNPRFSQTLAIDEPVFLTNTGDESAFLTNTGETRLQGKNSPGSRGRRRDVEDFYGIIEVPI